MRALELDASWSISALYGSESLYNDMRLLGLRPGHLERSEHDSLQRKYDAGAFSLQPQHPSRNGEHHCDRLNVTERNEHLDAKGDIGVKPANGVFGVGNQEIVSANPVIRGDKYISGRGNDQQNGTENSVTSDDGQSTTSINQKYVSGRHEGLSRNSNYCIAKTFVDRMQSLDRIHDAFRRLIEKSVGIDSPELGSFAVADVPLDDENIRREDSERADSPQLDYSAEKVNGRDSIVNERDSLELLNKNNFNNNDPEHNDCAIVHLSNYTNMENYRKFRYTDMINSNNNAKKNRKKDLTPTKITDHKKDLLKPDENKINLSDESKNVNLDGKIKMNTLVNKISDSIISKNKISTPPIAQVNSGNDSLLEKKKTPKTPLALVDPGNDSLFEKDTSSKTPQKPPGKKSRKKSDDDNSNSYMKIYKIMSSEISILDSKKNKTNNVTCDDFGSKSITNNDTKSNNKSLTEPAIHITPIQSISKSDSKNSNINDTILDPHRDSLCYQSELNNLFYDQGNPNGKFRIIEDSGSKRSTMSMSW